MIYLKEGKIPLNFSYNDEIVHEGNSKYQLSFKFPTNNLLWEELVEETLLLADDLHGEQEFIIFEVEKHHAYITVYANQVATLLNNYSITEISVNNASGDRVMRSLTSSIIRKHNFTFSSDIANTHSFNLKNVTVANALFRDKHSIIGQWGGDLIRDKYDIRLLSNGGVNKEALFMYKKNLKSYQQKKSIKDLRTRIHFTKTIKSQKEGEKDKVIAVTVDSPLINKYKNIYEGNLDVSDQDVIDEVTLRKYGENYFKTTLCDVIEESIEIDVVGRPDVPVGIFDTVTIFHEKFNLDVKKKITKYTYSPMGRKLKTIGFGKIQSNLGTTLASMVDNAVAEQVESKLDVFKIQKNLDQLLKLDKKSIEDKLVELEEKSKSAVEVKKALFEADGEIPEIVKTRILDAVEGNIARLKTIITEAEMIKSIQAQLNFAEIKNALIDKAFIKTLVSDESFRQQFEAGEVNTQNIFTKMRDTIQSSIRKDFITKEETKKLVNDLTISADGIRQIANEESIKTYESKKTELRGSDGKNAYVFKKYSNFADGRNMNDDSNSQYIGIYTGSKSTAPTDPTEYSWTKVKFEGKLYKGYANSTNGLDFTVVEPDDNSFLLAKNRPHVNITNDDISDIWQANMFLSLKPNTKYTLTARAKGNNNKLWAYFRNNKTSQEYPWGQLEFGNTLQTKSIVFTTGNDVDDVLFKFILVPEDENWTGVQVDWYTIHESERPYTDYPTNEPAQYHKYRYFGYVFKNGTPTASDFDWFDIQQKSITGDKYTHLVYSDSADGSNFGREPKAYMGIARTTSPVTPTDKKAFKWVRLKGDDGKSASNFNLLLNTEIKSSASYTFNGASSTINQNDLNGRNSVEINNNGLTGNAWKGISFISSKKEFKRGDRLVIRLPIYIYSDVNVDNGIHLALKSHVGNKTLTGFNLDNGTARDTWVIKEFTYVVQQDFTSPADNLFYIFSTKNGHFKVAEPYMSVGGDMPTEWIPSLEDLKAHSLSANVRVAGNYEGKRTNDVKFFVDVYYDGVKVTNGFNLTARVWGGGLNKTQENATYNNDGELTNVYYSNGEKDGTTINIKLDVEYQFLKTTCFARLDNLPDPELIKEVTNKYKTFDTTLEQFKSQIGELNDKQFKVAIRGKSLLNVAEKKIGNNLTYTTLEPMKPNNTYTLVADFRYFPANQELRIFNSERQRLVAGVNMFTFTVPTETRTINLTPLGNTTEVKNVEVWEGNYNEGLEDNSFDAVTGGVNHIVAIKLKNEFKEGRYYKIMFDTATPNNSVISIGIDEHFLTFNGGKVIPDNNYKPMVAKDNVLFTRISGKAPDNKEVVYLEFTGDFDRTKISNVRFYEINLGFRYTKKNEEVNIYSMLNQAKNEVSLSVKETLSTNYLTKAQTEASIKVMKDKIENVVTTDNFSTTLTQNARALRIAWNEISEYVQFEEGGLNFYAGTSDQNNLKARIDGGDYTFWRDGKRLGSMGTATYAEDKRLKGIQFSLENGYGGTSAFMGWGYREHATDEHLLWKWVYSSVEVGANKTDSLNAWCTVNFHDNLLENGRTMSDSLVFMDGVTRQIPIIHSITSRGDGGINWVYGNLNFRNGILISSTTGYL
nr:MAG TPA: Neck appendage protein [Caudoviricetes sp.]